jgi:cation:H+ antiporter
LAYIYIFALFVIGMIIILKSADWFVDAAVWIAESTGVPKMVIGATIVSFATTLPELVVSTFASWDGHPGVAIGNAVGSTICNIGFILGIAAIIKPFKIELRSFIYKAFIMLVSAVVLFFFLWDHNVTSGEGSILLMMFAGYLFINMIEVRSSANKNDQKPHQRKAVAIKVIGFLAGAVGVVIGAKLVVDNGVIIASILGVPERVISVTLISLGTSLPEFITSMTALSKGVQNISVGNIIGANILNILLVTGASAVINPLKVMHHAAVFDMPMSMFIMALLTITGITDKKIERWEGGILFFCYVLYISALGILFFD